MPPSSEIHAARRSVRVLAIVATGALLALGLGGCGGSADDAPEGGPAGATKVNLADFPRTDGQITLNELQKSVGAQQNTDLLPAANDFVRGRAIRLPFGLFGADRMAVWGPTAVYYARGAGAPAVGPFPAPAQVFNVPKAHRSSTTGADSASVGNGFYVARIPAVRGAKKIGVLALTRVNDGFEAAAVGIPLSKRDPTIAPGERVPAIDTPTGTTPERLAAIDTRDPHDGMHQISLKNALGMGKPIVLVFSTPKLCASRVCAPVTDVAEWVRHDYAGRVIFIHNEIYNENDLNRGYRPQVRAFGLPSEPFTFVIGADGKVVEQLQGPFSAAELRAAIEKAR